MYVLRVKVITDVMGWMNEVIKRILKKIRLREGELSSWPGPLGLPRELCHPGAGPVGNAPRER